MAETKKPAASSEQGRRNIKIGYVVSTKMEKTIVVKVDMLKAHKLYKRTIKRSKKFYAHDEQNSCRVGDVVRIVETRPMSKLMRWKLEEDIQKSTLVQGVEEKTALIFLLGTEYRVLSTGDNVMAVMMRSMLEVADNSG